MTGSPSSFLEGSPNTKHHNCANNQIEKNAAWEFKRPNNKNKEK